MLWYLKGIILTSLTDMERSTPNEGITHTITWARPWMKEKKKGGWTTVDINSLLPSLAVDDIWTGLPLSKCLTSLPQWSVNWNCNISKSFPPQVDFFRAFSHAMRNTTKKDIGTNKWGHGHVAFWPLELFPGRNVEGFATLN